MLEQGGEMLEQEGDTMRKLPAQAVAAEDGQRMKLEGEQTLLRVVLRSTDRYSWRRRTVEELLRRALACGLMGATVLEGEEGWTAQGSLSGRVGGVWSAAAWLWPSSWMLRRSSALFCPTPPRSSGEAP